MDKNTGLFAFLLLIMAVLPLSARAAQAGHGVKKGVRNLCVQGSWIKVGSFRFWKRSRCVKRRQMTPQPTLHDGPWPQRPGVRKREGNHANARARVLRNNSYNPNYGHEPYWEKGDWVFGKIINTKDSANYMCGKLCPAIYIKYGKVCGKNKDSTSYKNFTNYCALRNQDCRNVEGWSVIYRGTCYQDLRSYDRIDVVDKSIKFIENYMNIYPGYNTKMVGLCNDCPRNFLTPWKNKLL